jgi:predicted Holliday junction resolvase-like endonuclease
MYRLTTLLKNRQQVFNVFIVALSLNMYAQNEKIRKMWNELSVKENELKKQYNAYQSMINDNEWLLSVENRIIKSANQKKNLVNNSNNNNENNSSILQIEIYEKIPTFFSSSTTTSNVDTTTSNSNQNAVSDK